VCRGALQVVVCSSTATRRRDYKSEYWEIASAHARLPVGATLTARRSNSRLPTSVDTLGSVISGQRNFAASRPQARECNQRGHNQNGNL
jgi:hypothetical protein